MCETVCGHQPHHAKGYCKKCYKQQPRYKEKMKIYYQRPEVEIQKREYQRIYCQQRKYKEMKKAYLQRSDIKLKLKEINHQKHRKEKMTAFEMLGGAKCVNCGCDDFDFLEVNHINGGGGKDNFKFRVHIYRDVCYGRRKTDDLNVMCRVCNAFYYLQKNKPESAKRYKIIWKGQH